MPSGETEESRYNDLGQQTLHISFEGIVTEFVYDNTAGAGGRLIEKRFFLDEAAYDAYVLDPVANPPAETIAYFYDAFGRQIQITHDRGGTQDVWHTTYDEVGRVLREVSPQGAVNYEYDPATGQRTRTFTGSSGTCAGDQADPINDTRYEYDALGRLVSVTVHERNDIPLGSPETTSYEFDLLGQLHEAHLPNGMIAEYVHDELGRLDLLTHYAPDATPENLADNAKVLEFRYVIRNDGRWDAVTEKRWDASETLVSHTQTDWDYDALGRLTDEVFTDVGDLLAEIDDYSTGYTYDLVGNRLEKTTTSGGTVEKTTAAFDANDRLLSEQLDVGDDGSIEQTTTYSYTGTRETGRTVTDHVAGYVTRSITTSYDLQGRMAEVVTDEFSAPSQLSRSETVTYKYDPAGFRVTALHEVDSDGDLAFDTRTLTEYLVDRHNATGYAQTLQQTVTNADTGAELKKVVYAIGRDMIAQTTFTPTGPSEGETFGFAYDGHGSVRSLFDLVGALAIVAGVPQVFFYDAYGSLMNMSVAQAATSLLYSGEFLDATTGQQYLRARWYNPLTGRFSRLDPFFGDLQNPLSLHKYLYAHADPINGSDPTGLFTIGGMISAMGSQLNVASGDAAASLGVLYKGYQLKRFIGAIQQLYQLFNRIYDLVGMIRSIVEFLDMDPGELELLKNRALELVSFATGDGNAAAPAAMQANSAAATAAPTAGFYFESRWPLPFFMTTKLRKLVRWAGRVGLRNVIQERLGEAATAIIAEAIGFETPSLRMRPGPTGIDQLRRHTLIGTWGIFEAKGGSSRLGYANYGPGGSRVRQMSGHWIRHEIEDTIQRNRTSQEGIALRQAFNSRVPMLAAITRLNVDRVRSQMGVHAQWLVPPHTIGNWRRGA